MKNMGVVNLLRCHSSKVGLPVDQYAKERLYNDYVDLTVRRRCSVGDNWTYRANEYLIPVAEPCGYISR